MHPRRGFPEPAYPGLEMAGQVPTTRLDDSKLGRRDFDLATA